MSNIYEDASDFAEIREGRPLSYLPESALPPICGLFGENDVIVLKIVGTIVKIETPDGGSKRFMEIEKAEFVRR